MRDCSAHMRNILFPVLVCFALVLVWAPAAYAAEAEAANGEVSATEVELDSGQGDQSADADSMATEEVDAKSDLPEAVKPADAQQSSGEKENADKGTSATSQVDTTKSASETAAKEVAKQDPSLSGIAHVQDKGTIKASAKSDKKLSLGTTGQGKRLEGMSIKMSGVKGDISYNAHIQNIGWQGEKKNGSFAGTTGKSLQVEGLWIKINAAGYSVWYRAHVADNGWLGWASNGQKVGSEGLSKRMEALEVIILPNGQTPAGYNPNAAAFLQKMIEYTSHVQDIGTKSGYSLSLSNTITVGTTGKGKHLEGMSIKLNGVSGGISYNSHVQNIGWQGNKANGVFSGTKGQSKQVEAAQIKLAGQLAKSYDVFYRAHVANIGWMDWTKNGASAGTAGFSVPVEALQFMIVPKGSSKAPSTNGITYLDSSKLPSMTFESKSKGQGWKSVGAGSVSGTTGQGLALVGVGMKANAGNSVSGGISYLAHFANAGWTSWVSNGVRDTNASNPIQALKIKLTGNLSKYFDVYYRSHVSGYGWMGWASNGAASGTSGLNKNAEAYQVKFVVKGAAAPGPTSKSYSDKNGFMGMPSDQRAMLNRIAGYGSGTRYLIAVNRSTHKVGVFSGSTGNWTLQHYWSCVTGAPSTPTITGTFRTTGGKRMTLSTDSRAKWCTQIYGGYFFHTILASENELGKSLSHGCLRMAYSSAQWIYNNVKGGTTVTIYN